MSLDPTQVKAGIRALYTYLARASSSSSSSFSNSSSPLPLFSSDSTPILLTLTLKRTPLKSHDMPIRISIPHPLYSSWEEEGNEICLFTADPSDPYESILSSTPVDGLKKIIGLKELRKEYQPYKEKRKLLGSYQMFMADERIITQLTHLLGNKFFEKKKQPVPVVLTRKNLSEELKRARDSTYMFIPAGPCLQVKLGTSNFSRQQLYENIMSSIDTIISHLPRKWKNIQSIHIKTHDSIALPIYHSLPTMGGPVLNEEEKEAGAKKRKKPEREEEEEEEEKEEREEEEEEEKEEKKTAPPVSKKAKLAVNAKNVISKPSTTKPVPLSKIPAPQQQQQPRILHETLTGKKKKEAVQEEEDEEEEDEGEGEDDEALADVDVDRLMAEAEDDDEDEDDDDEEEDQEERKAPVQSKSTSQKKKPSSASAPIPTPSSATKSNVSNGSSAVKSSKLNGHSQTITNGTPKSKAKKGSVSSTAAEAVVAEPTSTKKKDQKKEKATPTPAKAPAPVTPKKVPSSSEKSKVAPGSALPLVGAGLKKGKVTAKAMSAKK